MLIFKMKVYFKKEEGKFLIGIEWFRYDKVLNVLCIKLDFMK